ncbi:MAG: hypothetical protein K2X86_16880 [Cytophagaceae bacterium]|nr:hypothetical protein [Cytophagaceae bacterium]
MKKLSFILLSTILFAFSCERKGPEKTEEKKEAKLETVKIGMDAIVDSLNKSWNAIINTDDQKFADIKRLLEEISYTNKYDARLQDSLMKQIEVVKAQRFDQNIDLNQMDKYDSITDAYILKVFELKQKTKGIEQHPLADELVEDIAEANSSQATAVLRLRYDRWAKQYNDYLKDNKKSLEKLGEPYASMKERARIMQ